MKVITDINEISDFIGLDYKPIHSGFYIFKLEDCKNIPIEVGHMYLKDFFEIFLTFQDDGSFTLGENKYTDLNNSICFAAPRQKYVYSRPSGISTGMGLLFKATFLPFKKYRFEVQNEFPFFKTHVVPIYKPSSEQLHKFYSLLEEIFNEQLLNSTGCIEIIQSYLIIILNILKRDLNTNMHQIPLNRYDEITNQFEELVFKYSSHKKRISDYASEMNISPVYLSECVKKSTRESPKQIITDYQILKSNALLHQTTKTISEIAYEMGFDENTNFTKFFKKHTGQTPKAFRQAILQEKNI